MTGLPIRVLLDVDTGIDDALALLYATATPRLDVVGVSAVVGNVPVDVGARNAAKVLAAVGETEVPVVQGAAFTTQGRGARRGPTNHGPDGLGGVSLAGPFREPGSDPLALLDRLTSDHPITVAACAPLTNVAQLARRKGVGRIVLVGGELLVEDELEFNIGHDPVAAAAVLATEVPTTVYPVDLFDRIVVSPSLVRRLQDATTAAAQLAGELLRVRRDHMLGDAGALVFLAHPELFEVTRARMAVTAGRLTPVEQPELGSVVDVVTSADADAVVAAFVEAVVQPRHCPE
ncbi:nucleoside hydrolase [Nocardioides houyundeii]|uniref:nucleoside hydrolase n=1 Tax=Nocardioides houyundeii TaxID=2045452 RepID=UPI000C790E71|nr:nucleoside hydrolase [Nocardioides houyundeii]